MGRQRNLTRNEVLAWNPNWSKRDRLRVANALDTVPMPRDEPYAVDSGGYVAVDIWTRLTSNTSIDGWSDRDGWRNGLVIFRGWLKWPDGYSGTGLDPDLFSNLYEGEENAFGYTRTYEWFALSTYRDRERGGRLVEEASPHVCARCFMELPATGACDYCG